MKVKTLIEACADDIAIVVNGQIPNKRNKYLLDFIVIEFFPVNTFAIAVIAMPESNIKVDK